MGDAGYEHEDHHAPLDGPVHLYLPEAVADHPVVPRLVVLSGRLLGRSVVVESYPAGGPLPFDPSTR